MQIVNATKRRFAIVKLDEADLENLPEVGPQMPKVLPVGAKVRVNSTEMLTDAARARLHEGVLTVE